jgi:hypothetical protein
MRRDVRDYIDSNNQLKKFIREQPSWYRKLTRNPHELQLMEIASLHYYQKTLPHKIDKFSNGVQMASMMMSMFQAMNSNE